MFGNIENSNIEYTCNICGSVNKKKFKTFSRENPNCDGCNSSVRLRSLMYMISCEFFGEPLVMSDFPIRKDISGIGMSDWITYALRLEETFKYQNTFYHQEPKLDISNINSKLEETLDFIVSTDVFEHVLPPVDIAFLNVFKMLKSKGKFIFSVPYTFNEETDEHFPDLNEFSIIRENKTAVLKNITKDGKEQTYKDLVFHGGDGSTLEMRVFSKNSLLKKLKSAGFNDIKIYAHEYIRFGIIWDTTWSLPICATKF